MNSVNDDNIKWKPNVLVLGSKLNDYYIIGGILRMYNDFFLNLDSIVCCGSSCVIGMMLCLGYSPLEIVELTEGDHYIGEDENFFKRTFFKLASDSRKYNNTQRDRLKELIIKKIGHDGTLLELYNACGIELICVLSLKDTEEAEYVSYKNYPDELISNTILSSLSLPLFNEEQKLNDRTCFNGIFIDPLPVKIKDDEKNQILVLFSIQNTQVNKSLLINELVLVSVLSIKELIKRTIQNISSNCRVIQFIGDTDETKSNMIKSGYKQVSDYLELNK